jgi:predicted outer membrane repeat protein
MRTLENLKCLVLVAVCLLAMVCAAQGKVIYVDDTSPGANLGSSWAHAFWFLQDALAAAEPGDEIWVAEGVYKPDRGAGFTPEDQEASFELVDKVAIYGGFPNGGGTRGGPEERDPSNETVLSGDLKGNDRPSLEPEDLANLHGDQDRRDNSYHVISATECSGLTILDTVTVTGGNAYRDGQDNLGGGIYMTHNASPTIRNCKFVQNCAAHHGGAIYTEHARSLPEIATCVFSKNAAYLRGGALYAEAGSAPRIQKCEFVGNYTGNHTGFGGGIYNKGASPQIEDCLFMRNEAWNHGGALYNESSYPTVRRCRFIRNSAIRSYGGAIYNDRSDPTVEICAFVENESGSDGGAIYNERSSPTICRSRFCGNISSQDGGAMRNANGSHANLINCVFSSNSLTKIGSFGGAIENYNSDPILVNCTFYLNYADKDGGGIYNRAGSEPNLTNCILEANLDTHGTAQDEEAQISGDTPIINYCCVMGWTGALGGEGNFDADPRFQDPEGPDMLPGTEDDNLRLLTDSPCIDAGDNRAVPLGTKTDIDGVNRFTDAPGTADTGRGMAPIVDIGAAELCPLWLLPTSSSVRQDWEQAGRPFCWCAPYQCYGDADGGGEGRRDYRTSTIDLDILIAAWNKPYADIEGEKLDDVPLVCADFNHAPQGKKKYRVSTDDLDILVANWNTSESEMAGDCPR